jgi:ADP-heptose:LPS heptosyltransferase
LAAAVAGLVRRLIQAGIRHADLHPGNVLVDPAGQVYLVDFDKGRRVHGDPLRLWLIYRRRWNRAAAKHRLPPGLAEMLEADREEDTRRFPSGAPRPIRAANPSILIILMGSLGDVARGLSLIVPLKARFPQSRLTWLVEPKCADLVQMHPQLDEVLIFERRWHPAPVMDLARALRRRHFDITLDLQRHLKSGVFSRLSRARRRIGFHRRNAKELNWVFNNEHIPACPESLPKIRHYLKFVEALGAAVPPQLDFGLGHVAIAGAPPQIRALSRPFIAVALGSSWPSKDWHAEGYRTLIDRVLTSGKLAIVLTGDGSQVPLAAGLVSALNRPELIDLTGRTTIPQLAAVLKAARAAAGPDCGSAHLAAAVGTPYVSLFGPTDPSRTAPHGGEHLVIRSPTDCAPCYRKRCPIPGHPCMRGIDIDSVLNLLESLISKTASPPNNFIP